MKKKAKKILKIIGIILGVLVVIVGGYLIYAFASYYRLPDNLELEVMQSGDSADFEVDTETTYSIMTYNIGFGAYSADYTFFMDGGKYSWALSEDAVHENISAIGEVVTAYDPDFMLIQEIDLDSTRSYHINELDLVNEFMQGYYYTTAQDYDSPFLFYPLWQPHGASKAVLATYSRAEITSAIRRSLPISESFSKMLDLDRCYSISRIPTSNGKELCIYNLHLSAYGGDASIRTNQLNMLYEDMTADYAAGNYVVCGGDFNHNMKGTQVDSLEWASNFPVEGLPDGFTLGLTVADAEKVEHNSCRNADIPYEEGNYTVTLDAFIVSDNVTISNYEHLNYGYAHSDHDPVVMEFSLN